MSEKLNLETLLDAAVFASEGAEAGGRYWETCLFISDIEAARTDRWTSLHQNPLVVAYRRVMEPVSGDTIDPPDWWNGEDNECNRIGRSLGLLFAYEMLKEEGV